MNEIEYDKYLKQQEINKKHEYKKELQDQMIFKEKIKRCKYEEFLREKKLIDQVVERIHQEDERALQEKWLKMQKTKAEMVAFKEAQDIWKQKQRQQIEDENKKIQEYMFSKQSDVQAKWVQKQQFFDNCRFYNFSFGVISGTILLKLFIFFYFPFKNNRSRVEHSFIFLKSQ